MCLGIRGSDHVMALGARMTAGVPAATGSDVSISDVGYQAILYEDGADWIVQLKRYIGAVGTVLGSHILGSGSVGNYKWFHLRLDVLLQPNGDATIQVFENDPVANPINPSDPPTWGSVWSKIIEVADLAANVPVGARVGWGGQVDPGAGAVEEGYMDWTECWYS